MRQRQTARIRASAQRLETLAERAAKLVRADPYEPIRDRLVSLIDPDARPIGKGKLRESELL